MFAVSALDVAFVSAFAAVAAAVAAPLASWLVASANNRHDRWVKTYADLRDAYVGLLRTLYSRHVVASALIAAVEANDPDVYDAQATVEQDAAERVERLALTGAFASNDVMDAVQAWDEAWKDVIRVVTDAKLETAEERQASVAALTAAIATLREPMRRVRRAIREDLRNQAPGKPLPRSLS